MTSPGPAWVYRVFDRNDVLLYVGVSTNPNGRFNQHAQKVWWPNVARIELDLYGDRATAEWVEELVISVLAPTHNKVGVSRGSDEFLAAISFDHYARRFKREPPAVRGIEDKRAQYRTELDELEARIRPVVEESHARYMERTG